MANIDNNTTNLENILDTIDDIADPVSGTLSITTNGTHDVSIYANANVNVQSAPVLLWTNASPTSEFAAQTVSVATGYSAYLVEYNDYETIYYLPLNVTQNLAIYSGEYNDYGYWRSATAKNGSVVFGDADRIEHSYSDDNYCCIPIHIWGVKFTL